MGVDSISSNLETTSSISRAKVPAADNPASIFRFTVASRIDPELLHATMDALEKNSLESVLSGFIKKE